MYRRTLVNLSRYEFLMRHTRVIARYLAKTAKSLSRKGKRYNTGFYGTDDGEWEARQGFILGFRKEGFDWEVVSSMSSKNDWRTLSVEGATEHHSGFRKALKEMVSQYPELLDFWIQFDGPYKPVSDLVGGPSGSREVQWSSLTFYHGTSMKAWESIERQGLRPRSATNVVPAYGTSSSAGAGKAEAIYLTTQLQMAHFAANDASRVSKSQAVVLRVKGIDGDHVAADEDSGESTGAKSLERLGSIAYLAPIPASKISLYEVWLDRDWERV